MELLGVTNEMKKRHPQRCGKLLGETWQKVVTAYLDIYSPSGIGDAVRFDTRRPTDVVVDSVAIDTKYRFGSGDNNTITHLVETSRSLRALGYRPVMIILRDDSLRGALNRFRLAGWEVAEANNAFDVLADLCRRAPRLDELLIDLRNLQRP